LTNNFGNNELILNSKENEKIGLKYGETLEKYSSLNSKLYAKDEQIYFDYGYDYQYKNDKTDPSMNNEPWEIRVLYIDTDFSNYGMTFHYGRVTAKKDIRQGYMNRVNPEFKSDMPLLEVTDVNKNINIYLKGKEATLMELYEFNKK